MRIKYASRNITLGLIVAGMSIALGLISQRIFLNTLGSLYLGINGLFTSIISMLALVELGLGSAIYYHMYSPVAKKDTPKISSLVKFYKKWYRIIALAVFALGMSLMPFLRSIVGSINISESIYVIYLLFLFDAVASYLLTYKRALLYVDQNSHIISAVHLVYLIVLNALQIAILLLTRNFYLYLAIKVVMRLIENGILNSLANKKYPYLKNIDVVELDKSTKLDIFKKVKGLSYHKVAGYIVLGTDNIIISLFLGVSTVGLYSNYLLVTSAIIMLIGQAFTAITASVGNLLVSNNSKKSFEVYKKISFMNFWLACFATTSLLVIMNSFITLWIGSQYLLPIGVLLAICLNLYLTLIRSAIGSFKEAAGIFHEDRFVPVIESIANLLFSLVFLKLFGLAGILLGTALSTLILHLYSYPEFVYKPLFKRGLKEYYLDLLSKFVLLAVVSGITFAISRAVQPNSKIYALVFCSVLCLLVPNALLYLVFRKSIELKYYQRLFYNLFSRNKKKIA